MEMELKPMCLACRHLDRENSRTHSCNAFKEGIPEEIWTNRFDHHNPYPGDDGVRFEIMAITEKATARAEKAS